LASLRKKSPNRRKGQNENLVSYQRPQADLQAQPISAVDFEKVRDQIINLVCSRALETVDQMMEHVRAGNFQAMKYLFEMVGLFPAPAKDAAILEESAIELSGICGKSCRKP
jgi:hypothetical protein